MSHQPEQNPQSITTFASLEGGWLRKERERIAIGRKALATKLGSSESRVHTIEWRRQPVPMEWLPVLRGLSFRIPDEVDAALGTTSQQSDSQQVAAPVAESVAAPSVESVGAPVAESVAAPVVQSAVESAVKSRWLLRWNPSWKRLLRRLRSRFATPWWKPRWIW